MTFWNKLTVPTQDEYLDVEYINPAEAYRRQADAINLAAPLYAELEVVDAQLSRASRVERELTRRILAQAMKGMKGVQTRTNELIDAFVLAEAERFRMDDGTVKDVRHHLLKMRRRIERLQVRKDKLERRLKAIQMVADYCDRIMNWAKHEARLEVTSRRS